MDTEKSSSPKRQKETESVWVRVQAPEDATGRRNRFIFLLDTSGSMEENARGRDHSYGRSETVFTKLDVLKLAMKGAIGLLSPLTEVAVIEFNSLARHVLPLQPFTAESRKVMDNFLQRATAHGSTNLTDAFESTSKLLNSAPAESCRNIIVLFSDGQPDNIKSVESARTVYQKFRQSVSNSIDFSLCTFMTGVDREGPDILHTLSIEGRGLYSFNFDGSTIAQSVIHFMARQLAVTDARSPLIRGSLIAGLGHFAKCPVSEIPQDAGAIKVTKLKGPTTSIRMPSS